MSQSNISLHPVTASYDTNSSTQPKHYSQEPACFHDDIHRGWGAPIGQPVPHVSRGKNRHTSGLKQTETLINLFSVPANKTNLSLFYWFRDMVFSPSIFFSRYQFLIRFLKIRSLKRSSICLLCFRLRSQNANKSYNLTHRIIRTN